MNYDYRKKSPRILVTGITSLRLNVMEFDNLGNFIIIEPFFRSLRENFPESEIQTTLQLTSVFADKYQIRVLKSKSYWEYNLSNTIKIFFDFLLSVIWRLFNTIGFDLNPLLKNSDRLNAFLGNDLIIDFSGDMYGDNALNTYQFLIGSINPLLARLLKKKIFFVASSPGPFKSTIRLIIAKYSLKTYDLVSVREPVSLHILNGIGLVGEKYCCYPCFSYGFKPDGALSDEEIYKNEPRLSTNDKPVIGMILCNLNMRDTPPNKWPRDDYEFKPFIELITHMIQQNNVNVCIFSHRNKTDFKGNIIKGSDHSIISRIMELIPNELKDNVFTINGIYDAATMNRIIGQFEILVSGRIHGAVQGIMQYVPTLIIDYGMEPRAHKLKGFSLLCGLNDYICDPSNANDMKSKASKMWINRQNISDDLSNRIPNIVIDSQMIWKRIKSTCENDQ